MIDFIEDSKRFLNKQTQINTKFEMMTENIPQTLQYDQVKKAIMQYEDIRPISIIIISG